MRLFRTRSQQKVVRNAAGAQPLADGMAMEAMMGRVSCFDAVSGGFGGHEQLQLYLGTPGDDDDADLGWTLSFDGGRTKVVTVRAVVLGGRACWPC